METKGRKAVGAAENNRNEVRELIASVKRFANGICVFNDRADNMIYVDTEQGITAKLIKVIDTVTGESRFDYKWYEDGTTSKKDNGYVYTPIVINGLKGRQEVFMSGTHSLIGMLAHTEDFDSLIEDGKTPELNHKNNRKWDNRGDNGEWTTKGGNTRHGKIVVSLQHHYPDQYTHIEHNAGDTDFIVLNTGLSVKDIERYCDSINDSKVFKCENDEYIEVSVLDSFVDWLIDTGVWAGNVSLVG